jgi:hypothetical protein
LTNSYQVENSQYFEGRPDDQSSRQLRHDGESFSPGRLTPQNEDLLRSRKQAAAAREYRSGVLSLPRKANFEVGVAVENRRATSKRFRGTALCSEAKPITYAPFEKKRP